MKCSRITGILIRIAFIVMVSAASCSAMATKSQTGKTENTMHNWTVAKVIEDKKNDYIKVIFLESARFYKLMRDNANLNTYLSILKKAEKNNSSVKVRLTEPHGDIIEHVE